MSDLLPAPDDQAVRIPPLDAQNAEGALNADLSSAAHEQLAYADKNLDETSRKNEHRRDEGLRDTVHRLFDLGIKGAFILYCLAVLTVSCHYLLPEKCRWLSADQLHTVTTVVFSGAVMSRGGQYLSRRVR